MCSSNYSQGSSSGRSSSSYYDDHPDDQGQFIPKAHSKQAKNYGGNRSSSSDLSQESDDDYYEEEDMNKINKQDSSFYQPAGHLRRAVNANYSKPGPAKKAEVVIKGSYQQQTKYDRIGSKGRNSRQQSNQRATQRQQPGARAIISAQVAVNRNKSKTGKLKDRESNANVNFFNTNTSMREVDNINKSVNQGSKSSIVTAATGTGAANRTVQNIQKSSWTNL